MVAYIAKCFMVGTLAPDFAVVKLIIDATEMVVPGELDLLYYAKPELIFCGQLLGLWQWGAGAGLSPHRRSRSQRPLVSESLSSVSWSHSHRSRHRRQRQSGHWYSHENTSVTQQRLKQHRGKSVMLSRELEWVWSIEWQSVNKAITTRQRQ